MAFYAGLDRNTVLPLWRLHWKCGSGHTCTNPFSLFLNSHNPISSDKRSGPSILNDTFRNLCGSMGSTQNYALVRFRTDDHRHRIYSLFTLVISWNNLYSVDFSRDLKLVLLSGHAVIYSSGSGTSPTHFSEHSRQCDLLSRSDDWISRRRMDPLWGWRDSID